MFLGYINNKTTGIGKINPSDIGKAYFKNDNGINRESEEDFTHRVKESIKSFNEDFYNSQYTDFVGAKFWINSDGILEMELPSCAGVMRKVHYEYNGLRVIQEIAVFEKNLMDENPTYKPFEG